MKKMKKHNQKKKKRGIRKKSDSKSTQKIQPKSDNKSIQGVKETKKRYIIQIKKLVPRLEVGDEISMHWNHAIQVLTQRDIKNLQKYTQKTLDSLNTAL